VPTHVVLNLIGFSIISTIENSTRKIYSTDGTADGTILLDTITGTGSSIVPRELGTVGGRALYVVYKSSHFHIYSTDGTVAGTRLLLTTTGNPEGVSDLGSTGSRDLFSTIEGSTRKIYSTDGSAAGTILLDTLTFGDASTPPRELGTVNGLGLYTVYRSNHYQVYSTDGTVAGTRLLLTTTGNPEGVSDLGSAGSRDLFSTIEGSTRKIYSTDGTLAGTVLLDTLTFGDASTPPRELGTVNGLGLYTVYRSDHYQVYSTDGTVAGTRLLLTTNGNPEGVVDLGGTGGRDLFSTIEGSTRKIYSTDGTLAGTVLLDTLTFGDASIPPRELGTVNGLGLYTVYRSNHYQVYSTDGTVAGTRLLLTTNGNPEGVVDLGGTGGRDLFSTIEGSTRKIYSTDGSAAGTILLDTLTGGDASIPPRELGTLNGLGLYAVYKSSHYHVYSTDGTLAGTRLLLTTSGNPEGVVGIGSVTDGWRSGSTFVDVQENQAVAADIDAVSAAAGISFRIVGGADAARFAIDAITGMLTFVAVPNHENPGDAGRDNVYDVIVRATAGSLTRDQALAIRVGNVNDPPAITSNGGGISAALNVAENKISVVTLSASDPDAASTLTYRIEGGADAALFRINAATGALTFAAAPDFERPADANRDNDYEVIVAVSDGLATDTQSLSVRLTNVVESASEGNLVFGTSGNDVITESVTAAGQPTATVRDDVVLAAAGDDQVYGGAGADRLDGGPGNDVLGGDAGDDFIDGGDGGDTLYGWTGADLLDGGAGRDLLLGDDGDDRLNGGADDDQLWGWNDDDALDGGEGGDQLSGEAGNDTIVGGSGNDWLDGGSGSDSMAGGPGDDVYIVDNVLDLVTEAAGAGTDEVRTYLADSTAPANVETLTGLLVTGQTLRGNSLANLIAGGSGADRMVGGTGHDTYVVDNAGDVVEENAGEGSDAVRTSLAVYSLAALPNIEALIGTSASGQTLTGNSASNRIEGGGGNDVIHAWAGGGGDTVLGNGGNDTFFFAAAFTAADTVRGGAGIDTFVIQGPYGSLALAGNLTEIENISILAGSNTAFGEPGTNRHDYVLTTHDSNFAAGVQARINAAALLEGEDFTFNGSAETDASYVVYGGKGKDTLLGGLGNDIFFYAEERFASGDTVNGGAGYDGMFLRGNYTIDFNAPGYTGLFTNIENLTLTSATDERYARGGGTEFDYNLILSDAIVGAGQELTVSGALLMASETMILDASQETDGILRLFGGLAADTLKGGANADLLYGAFGADILAGGGGADLFRYQAVTESYSVARDHIVDFTPGTDRIELDRIDASRSLAGDQAFTWIGSNAFSNTAGELRAFQSGAQWIVQGDINGDGHADLIIALTLQGPAPLGAGDFVL